MQVPPTPSRFVHLHALHSMKDEEKRPKVGVEELLTLGFLQVDIGASDVVELHLASDFLVEYDRP